MFHSQSSLPPSLSHFASSMAHSLLSPIGKNGHRSNNWREREREDEEDDERWKERRGGSELSVQTVNISDLSLDSHGTEKRELALLMYTFGEPETTKPLLFNKILLIVFILILVSIVFNPWLHDWLLTKIKSPIIRFVLLIIIFLVLLSILILLFPHS